MDENLLSTYRDVMHFRPHRNCAVLLIVAATRKVGESVFELVAPFLVLDVHPSFGLPTPDVGIS